MRSARFGLLLCLLLLNISVWGQQTQPSTAPAPAPQDSQAVSVLNQALAVAGGASAIRAVQDYTATGTITFPSQHDAQGPITMLGMNGTEFRMDANLPAGTRSWAVADGVITTKNEQETIWSMAPKGPVPSSDAFPFQTPLFPASIAFPDRQLAAVVGNPSYALVYKGASAVDGHSVHEIEFQLWLSAAASARRWDIFVDAATFQIVKVSDALPRGEPRAFHYSDYRAVAGVLMPFSIAEETAGQQIWTIQLNQVNFNMGLQEASFAIQ